MQVAGSWFLGGSSGSSDALSELRSHASGLDPRIGRAKTPTIRNRHAVCGRAARRAEKLADSHGLFPCGDGAVVGTTLDDWGTMQPRYRAESSWQTVKSAIAETRSESPGYHREATQSRGRLGIGILAHNETARLPALFESLFQQSIFRQIVPGLSSIHVACVPNGCTDDTAAVAKRELAEAAARLAQPTFTWSVDELAEAGKAGAWNHCVHTCLADCEILCFLDADIVFANDDTIASVLTVLSNDPRLCVVTDQPIKRTDETSAAWLSGLSRVFSQSAAGPTEICGQFYCARAAVLRTIWLPPGLPVEDGFLRAMVITDEFRHSEDPHRITRAEQAFHYFEPKLRPRDLWRHKKRLMIGTTLNILLFRNLWLHAGNDGAGSLLRDRLQRNPAWLSDYLSQECRRSSWLVPMGHVLRRLLALRSVPLPEAARRAPMALAATALDLAAAVSANREIKRNLGLGFW